MRVVSGALKGLKLEAILKNEKIRPTTDKVKESLFNILQFEIKGKIFLDLFGGSGQIGIEAASRGAEEVIIVENSPIALSTIKKNVNKLKQNFNIEIVNSEAIEFLEKMNKKIDIAFLDPPYGSDLLEKALGIIEPIINEGGIIVAETMANKILDINMRKFKEIKSYKYGNIVIKIYRDLDYLDKQK